MLALTVKQPWAKAIASGIKPVENRTWRPSPNVIGRRIAIHAGKSPDRQGWPRFNEMMIASGHADHSDASDGSLYFLGGVIAVATLAEVVTDHPSPFFVGPIGFVLADVVRLARPVPCRGALGFRRLPDAVEEQLVGVVA